jgi:hypothetical protein
MDLLSHFAATSFARLESIPATFWGVLAGSFFSLGGVWLSNRNSARNLRLQLQHDQMTRSKDREMVLRRDAYLAVAEAISSGFQAVGRFADLKNEGEALTATYFEKAPAIAKVSIVARLDTLKVVLAVQSELSAVFMRLHTERIAGTYIKRDLLVTSKRLDSYIKNQTRSVELMNEENLKGRPDGARWDAIQRNFKFESAQIESDFLEQRRLERDMQDAQMKLAAVVSGELVGLNKILAPAMAAVRRELDMPIDEHLLDDILVQIATKQDESLTAFIEEARAEFARRQAPP